MNMTTTATPAPQPAEAPPRKAKRRLAPSIKLTVNHLRARVSPDVKLAKVSADEWPELKAALEDRRRDFFAWELKRSRQWLVMTHGRWDAPNVTRVPLRDLAVQLLEMLGVNAATAASASWSEPVPEGE